MKIVTMAKNLFPSTKLELFKFFNLHTSPHLEIQPVPQFQNSPFDSLIPSKSPFPPPHHHLALSITA